MSTPHASRMAPAAVFDDSGHLSDGALVALADGQDVLPDEATTHLAVCDACCGRLADAAYAAVRVGEMLRDPAPARPVPAALTAPAPPAPWRVVGVAFALSLVGLMPSIVRLPAAVSRAIPALTHLGPALAHRLSAAFGAHGPAAGVGASATLASSVLLIVFGFTIARWFRHEGVAS